MAKKVLSKKEIRFALKLYLHRNLWKDITYSKLCTMGWVYGQFSPANDLTIITYVFNN